MAARLVDTIRQRAEELGANGCSGVPEFFHDCCLEHDIYYRTHLDLDGVTPITRAEADRRFRTCMQAASTFGVGSPMSWWRWLAVRAVGWIAWEKKT